MTSRAVHEIQSDAYRLIEVRIKAAVDSQAWATLYKLADQLQEIAERGLYHASRASMADVAEHAGTAAHGERDCR